MQIPKSIIILVYLVIFFSLYGCHPLFCIWNSGYTEIDHHVKVSNLTGVYTLTDYSKKMMYYEGKYQRIPNSKLQLNADSTYIITNAPDWLSNSFGESHGRYFTKKGRWSLSCYDKNGCDIEVEGVGGGGLYQKKSKIDLLFTVGDPDGCQGMVYEKQ